MSACKLWQQAMVIYTMLLTKVAQNPVDQAAALHRSKRRYLHICGGVRTRPWNMSSHKHMPPHLPSVPRRCGHEWRLRDCQQAIILVDDLRACMLG